MTSLHMGRMKSPLDLPPKTRSVRRWRRRTGNSDARLSGRGASRAVSRDLRLHPHVHCVVTGGGLDGAGRWVAASRCFLFSVKAMGKLFRGKFTRLPTGRT